MEKFAQALAQVTRAYHDSRIHYCRLEVALLNGDCCALAGTVLDQDTLAGVLAGLSADLPGIAFNATRVHVLRAGAAPAVVATNLTGLYADSSFLAEQISQLLNGQPLELLLEEGRWHFVRQADGYLGWAYGPYLAAASAPAATHLVCAPVSLLRGEPSVAAPLVNRVLGGTTVAATVLGDWARATLAGDRSAPLRPGLDGWLPAADLRTLAALPADEAGRRSQIMADAARFIGVPYLWGGCSAFGIDCSGFAQLLHQLAGVIIPRDADMQYDAGQPVSPPFHPGDLLFFGEGAAEARKITHVAVSLGGWRVIHSSRSRNGVQEDDVQAVEHLRESFVGARTFLAVGR